MYETRMTECCKLVNLNDWYFSCYTFLSICIPGEGNGCPLQYSCLENSIDIGAW